MELPNEKILILAIFAALGCGLMGGLLFAFSNFVMTALAHQPPSSGVRTMQAINVYILNRSSSSYSSERLSCRLFLQWRQSFVCHARVHHCYSPDLLCT